MGGDAEGGGEGCGAVGSGAGGGVWRIDAIGGSGGADGGRERVSKMLVAENVKEQQELANAVMRNKSSTGEAKEQASGESWAAATKAVVRATTQAMAIAPSTQPIVVRPTTRAVVTVAPTTMPATAPAVVMMERKAALPRPPTTKLKVEDEGISDQQIGDAIQKGASFLLTQFK